MPRLRRCLLVPLLAVALVPAGCGEGEGDSPAADPAATAEREGRQAVEQARKEVEGALDALRRGDVDEAKQAARRAREAARDARREGDQGAEEAEKAAREAEKAIDGAGGAVDEAEKRAREGIQDAEDALNDLAP